MAFLDNSGDIILDAVLTDTGRYRLAKGDGSFKITKFALGDDEIDYSLYNKEHPNGSAYYDLDILQTPILEALTDNASALKSHLLSVNKTDFLFLPVIKLFENAPGFGSYENGQYFIVTADSDTEEDFKSDIPTGMFFTTNGGLTSNNFIMIHQGLDTNKLANTAPISDDLRETIYMVEMDDRLGSLLGNPTQNNASPTFSELERSYIDDDQIATYILSIQKNGSEIQNIGTEQGAAGSSIAGPRGTSLKLKLKATDELETSTYLFEELGTEITINSIVYFAIDTNLRITGATTGYRIDIPIRYIKKKPV